MRIPLIKPDLPRLESLSESFGEILISGRITNFGRYVVEFEQKAGEYLGTHALTVSSGTAGLILVLQALGVRSGQKVILPSFTFMATAQAVLYAGGLPVFAEIGDDLTMSPSDLCSLLARHPDVAVVLPVHMYGLPCRVDEIQAAVESASRSRSQPPAVVYDAAHAFGSALGERRVGTFGNAEVFSLSVTKVLVSVEGGMVSTRDPQLVQRLRKMRNYGIEQAYDAHWPGLNAKMSEFHAIIGLRNLGCLEAFLAERQSKARYYLEGVRSCTQFQTLPWPPGVRHTFKDLTVILPEALTDRRDALIAFLGERGIETRAYFSPPVHQQKLFRQFSDRPLPRTEEFARQVLTLPFYTTITQGEMDYVVDALAEAERHLT